MDDLSLKVQLRDFYAHTEEVAAEWVALCEQQLAALERLQLWHERGDRLLAALEDDE